MGRPEAEKAFWEQRIKNSKNLRASNKRSPHQHRPRNLKRRFDEENDHSTMSTDATLDEISWRSFQEDSVLLPEETKMPSTRQRQPGKQNVSSKVCYRSKVDMLDPHYQPNQSPNEISWNLCKTDTSHTQTPWEDSMEMVSIKQTNTPTRSDTGSSSILKGDIVPGCYRPVSSEHLIGSYKSEPSANLTRDSWIWFSPDGTDLPRNVENFSVRQDKYRSSDPRVPELIAEINRQDQMNKDIKRQADTLMGSHLSNVSRRTKHNLPRRKVELTYSFKNLSKRKKKTIALSEGSSQKETPNMDTQLPRQTESSQSGQTSVTKGRSSTQPVKNEVKAESKLSPSHLGVPCPDEAGNDLDQTKKAFVIGDIPDLQQKSPLGEDDIDDSQTSPNKQRHVVRLKFFSKTPIKSVWENAQTTKKQNKTQKRQYNYYVPCPVPCSKILASPSFQTPSRNGTQQTSKQKTSPTTWQKVDFSKYKESSDEHKPLQKDLEFKLPQQHNKTGDGLVNHPATSFSRDDSEMSISVENKTFAQHQIGQEVARAIKNVIFNNDSTSSVSNTRLSSSLSKPPKKNDFLDHKPEHSAIDENQVVAESYKSNPLKDNKCGLGEPNRISSDDIQTSNALTKSPRRNVFSPNYYLRKGGQQKVVNYSMRKVSSAQHIASMESLNERRQKQPVFSLTN